MAELRERFEYAIPVRDSIWVKFVQEVPAQLSSLYPVTATLSVEADQERLTWFDETAVAVRLEGVDGAVESDGGGGVTTLFVTVTFTAEEVVVFPAWSLATAVRSLEPLVDWLVFQETEYGEAVSSEPRFTPSSLN